MRSGLRGDGARNRNRTGTTFRSRDFKSLVSTYFTIRAEAGDYTCLGKFRLEIGTGTNAKGKCKSALPLWNWSGRRVSNSRPIPWQGIALPTELLPRKASAHYKGLARPVNDKPRLDAVEMHFSFAVRINAAFPSRQDVTRPFACNSPSTRVSKRRPRK